jgi:pyruvate/2-oxoacid:ferredoxin oxidoreductase beta subunit
VIGFKIASDLAIQTCRLAVRTNYFPLWEMEDGKFRMTQTVNEPLPIQDYLKLVGKFSHFNEEDIKGFQEAVNDRFATVKALCDLSASKEPHGN